jgi:N-acetyl-anhydromuramyl-L-alanine amidase AmpD
MNINVDNIIRNKYHEGFTRKLAKPKEIIIHGTGGGYTLEWMRNGGRAEQYYKGIGLFHYLIERDGKIWEIIHPDRWVYHSCRGRKDRKSIGIELENFSRTNQWDYSDAQYEALFWLSFDYLYKMYPKIDVIMSHKRAWQKATKGKKYKECPGSGFDWKRVEAHMNENKFAYQHDDRYESYWGIREVV